MRRFTLATVTALILLAGCTSGGESDGPSGGESTGESTGSAASDEPSASAPATTEAPTGPDCDTVWQAGQVLPADYTSCVTDGVPGTQDVTECTDGSSLIVYLDSQYAVTGGEIVEPDVAPLQDTEEFGAVYSACTGE